ncbi:MAG: hypothetical protein QN168_05465 [Armatimonadota bacterium]|nr:hypothetical protein [Armatimonadota bacterium]
MAVLPAVVTLALAAATPTPRWMAVHAGIYQLTVPARQTMTLVLPIPPPLRIGDRPLTMTWSIVRPVPAPHLLVLEQCVQPEQCYATVLRPNGWASGTVRTTFRVTNRTAVAVDIRFRYTVWNVP